MKYRHRAQFGAAIVAAAFGVAGFAGTAGAQIFGGGEIAELRSQVERLQRDTRDLQAEVFRDGNTGGGAAAAIPTQRLDDIEQGLQRLTGDMEQLTFQMNQITQRLDRMQNQIDLVERNQSQSFSFGLPPEGGAADGGYPMPNGEPQEFGLAPSQGNLGTIPQGTPLPAPAGPLPNFGGDDLPPGAAANNGGGFGNGPSDDPQAEFDAAMTLLTRAQYDRAADAFRGYSSAYPDTDLGGQALYWTADIAYSVNRDYQGAARDFAELLRQYPDTARAPEAMLKLGMSLFALGQKQEGCVTLAALPRSYPNASATIANRARTERSNADCN